MRRKNFFHILLLLVLGLSLGSTGAPASAAAWQAKVDPWVLQTAESGSTEFLVELAEQADLSAADGLLTKEDKGRYVVAALQETARRTQAPLLRWLDAQGAAYRSYWVANLVWVQGDTALVQALASRPDVAHLYANPQVQSNLPQAEPTNTPQAVDAVEWNIAKINADDVWAAGYTGQGAVVAGQDTGYRWTHTALKTQYRGWDGSTADHDFNWHDAIHSGGGACGANTTAPCDDHGHGTHTMGTMTGDDDASNQVGVAPGARWIGCRNMNVGAGTPATYTECYQWFMAPTDISGTISDSLMAPDVINNSWGCPPSEGCTDPNVLLTVVENVRAAGILTVHSAGNYGGACSTIIDPAAIYDASFTIGGTTSTDSVYTLSSRGPVSIDSSGRLKPDVSAPGSGVRSSYYSSDSSYTSMSGTSMAAPHVAGLAALLISVNPELRGQVDLLEEIIKQSAFHLADPYANTCGLPVGVIPNYTFGYGRVDAWAAYQLVPYLEVDADAPPYAPSGSSFQYSITVTNPHPFADQPGVVVTATLPVSTTFLTATLPYTLDGDTISWDVGDLPAGQSTSVELTVSIDPNPAATITLATYKADARLALPVSGGPVITILLEPGIYLPLLLR